MPESRNENGAVIPSAISRHRMSAPSCARHSVWPLQQKCQLPLRNGKRHVDGMRETTIHPVYIEPICSNFSSLRNRQRQSAIH